MIMHATKIRGFALLVFAFSAVLIVGSSLYMRVHLQAYSERTRQVKQSLHTEHKLDETLSLVTDAETGPRGYVIMGQRRHHIASLRIKTRFIRGRNRIPPSGILANIADIQRQTGNIAHNPPG